jgi:hypothetical protein
LVYVQVAEEAKPDKVYVPEDVTLLKKTDILKEDELVVVRLRPRRRPGHAVRSWR